VAQTDCTVAVVWMPYDELGPLSTPESTAYTRLFSTLRKSLDDGGRRWEWFRLWVATSPRVSFYASPPPGIASWRASRASRGRSFRPSTRSSRRPRRPAYVQLTSKYAPNWTRVAATFRPRTPGICSLTDSHTSSDVNSASSPSSVTPISRRVMPLQSSASAASMSAGLMVSEQVGQSKCFTSR